MIHPSVWMGYYVNLPVTECVMRLKKAFPAVLLGVITAGLIMLGLTHVGINLFA